MVVLFIFINMKYSKYIIPALFIVTILFCCFRGCHKSTEAQQPATDTVVVTETDTIHETTSVVHFFPKPIKEVEVRWDTVRKDTILPIVSRTYSDTISKEDGAELRYIASVSGHNPSLDSISFDLTYPKITETKTVTVTEKFIQKAPRFTFGPSVGAGWGIFNKKPDLYVGFTATYRLN